MNQPRKRFNTTGPCDPARHYLVPPLPRLPTAHALVEAGEYFVIHAPRQTGKTTFLRAFARDLTARGQFAAVYLSCEAAEAFGDDSRAAQRLLGTTLLNQIEDQLPPALRPPPFQPPDDESRFGAMLRDWATHCPRKTVILLDEIDAVRGQSLVAILRQLRAGFPERPSRAPWSVVLCGLRDVRDYKAASGGDSTRLGTSSPFNIKVASLRISDFTDAESRALLEQHTAETGQPFEAGAIDRILELSQGQPWLLNALASELLEAMKVSAPITLADVDVAKERLVLARATHLDSLVSKLSEPRVRSVMLPLLAGELGSTDEVFNDDVSYVVDLGLVKASPIRIANPIYAEVIPRVLANPVQEQLYLDPRSFVAGDGRFDIDVLLREFAAFWVEQGDAMTGPMTYREADAQLVLMAYLQRVVNGGGTVTREFGIGRRRIDLLVTWPWTDGSGKRQLQRVALELKVWRDGRKDPLAEGLTQLDQYLDKVGLDAGILVLFDRRRAAAPVEDRTAQAAATTPKGRPVKVLRA